MDFLNCVMCLILIEFVSSAAIDNEKCLNTYIDCYDPKIKNVFESFIVDRLQPDETLKLVKKFKEQNSEFQCILSGCDEQLNEYLKGNGFLEWLLEKSKLDGGYHYNQSAHRSTPVLSDDDGTHSVRLNSNHFSVKGTDGLPSEEKSLLSENHLTVGDSWTDDGDLNDKLGDKQGVWDFSRNGSQYYTADIENNSSYPFNFVLEPELNLNKTIRSKREEKKCFIGDLTGSTVKCEKWPEVLLCKQKCSFGYGLSTDDGTKLGMDYKCRFSENVWQPQKFQDCKPYINCKVNLKEDEEGYLKCTQNNYRSAPTCYIKCGEKDVGKHYKCSDQYSDYLPECAELEEMELLYPPE